MPHNTSSVKLSIALQAPGNAVVCPFLVCRRRRHARERDLTLRGGRTVEKFAEAASPSRRRLRRKTSVRRVVVVVAVEAAAGDEHVGEAGSFLVDIAGRKGENAKNA